MAQYRYFKLGPEATLFTDPKSGLTVVNKIPTKIDANQVSGSTQVNEALRGGHLVEIQEEEYKKLISKESRKAAEADSATTLPPENTDSPTDDDQDEDDDQDGDEEEETIEDYTKSELIDLIKPNTEIPEEEKVGITKMSKEELWAIYIKYKS